MSARSNDEPSGPTRRQMLAAGGLGLALAAQPALAVATPRQTGPAGQNRYAPGFRRVDMQK